MKFPLELLDASVIEEISLDLWRELFDDVGWPATLGTKRTSLTHQDVLQAFSNDEPTDGLLQALDILRSLGTDSGREAIIAAMKDQLMPLDALPKDLGERELAIHLFLAQRRNAAFTAVLVRAQLHAQETLDHRRYNEFMAKKARRVGDLHASEQALTAATLAYCCANDLGDHVHVRVFEEDGVYVFHVMRSHHVKKPLAVVPGRSVRTMITFRPVHDDILKYDAVVGRLRIAARAASMVAVYQRMMGEVLFDDGEFFTGEPVCSLRVLQTAGPALLADHGVAGVGRVWMTECLCEYGDRELLHIRSRDCFRHMANRGLALSEGTLIQATLKIEVVGKSTRPVTVRVLAPNRIEVTQKNHEDLAIEFLTKIGVRNPKRVSTQIDLGSLYPWRHSEAAWRALFGGETDALVRRGVLLPVRLDAIVSQPNPGAGNVLAVHALEGHDYYGVSRADEIPSRSLSPTDVGGLELDPSQLAAYLRSRLGLTGAIVPWDGADLLDLGEVEVGDHVLRLYYVLRKLRDGAGDRIRRAAASQHAVLLMPPSLIDGHELASILLDAPLPSRSRVVREAIAACQLTDSVPALYTAPDNARLIVDTRLGKVWLDRVEIDGLKPGTHQFRFVERLARSNRRVGLQELATDLSSRDDGDTAARQAKLRARRLIDSAMRKAGRERGEDPFPSGPTGFYRCALVPYVV